MNPTIPEGGLNDIVEDPSEVGDEGYIDDEEFDETLPVDENNATALSDSKEQQHTRPPTTRSLMSSGRSFTKDYRRIRRNRPLITGLKKDPAIEAIREGRQSVVENAYTRLSRNATTAGQSGRPSQQLRMSVVDIKPSQGTNDLLNNILNRRQSVDSSKVISSIQKPLLTLQQQDMFMDDNFNNASIDSSDKSGIQIYEETCKRLNVVSCSRIIQSLTTSSLNLSNYGLGNRGCQALAVALIRNTTITSLNLAGNNIGSKGMSYLYQILTENTFIEDYDLSYNNLGTKGIRKLASSMLECVHLKSLNIAGNGLHASDIIILLDELEDHPNLKNLNLSQNDIDEMGGKYVAKWLSDNNVLLNLDLSWCSIRLEGAEAIANAIGDNNKLISLNLSYNSFNNDSIAIIANSLKRNVTLQQLNLKGNRLTAKYDLNIRDDPKLILKMELYELILAAATNQALKILRLGRNHIDGKCLIYMLDNLSKLDNITLDELDLTELTINKTQSDIQLLFKAHSKFRCLVGPVKKSEQQMAKEQLNLLKQYCDKEKISFQELFIGSAPAENVTITYEQFREGIKKTQIPLIPLEIEELIQFLDKDDTSQIELR
ncbi:unnamed protein product [Didymodactylos carnosus]|uniref:Uncharacterized protein n=1 Tax=Didymodactylos carnosus TaxID=1234261 RepID=A0A814EAT2_9BILA|nr:unnamed protein product [Didymodactylos carnosus]CAF0966890.1 unnamed protein product [Didymodactylos carnosus]CAF3672224.1 unnamed protein product [Didymodactylos carnosus]CAF3740384.1 unnamed protein product [Didymodactylos carnosus]